jgi:hypothetical protein
MLNWQEQKVLESENLRTSAALTVGIIGAVYTDGATIRFPGESAASSKRYPYNKDAILNRGDRVLLGRVAGSYVIICRF